MQDTETQQKKHVRIARQFLDAADKLFDEGDIIQTSEKLWGATNHAAKVLCLSRGWRHSKYAHLKEGVQRLAEEIGDSSLPLVFKVAQGNHINFYDDFMTAEAVDEDRRMVRALVEKLLAAAGQDGG